MHPTRQGAATSICSLAPNFMCLTEQAHDKIRCRCTRAQSQLPSSKTKRLLCIVGHQTSAISVQGLGDPHMCIGQWRFNVPKQQSQKCSRENAPEILLSPLNPDECSEYSYKRLWPSLDSRLSHDWIPALGLYLLLHNLCGARSYNPNGYMHADDDPSISHGCVLRQYSLRLIVDTVRLVLDCYITSYMGCWG